MASSTMDVIELVHKHLDESPDGLKDLVPVFDDILMGADADAICNAAYGERSAERTNKRIEQWP